MSDLKALLEELDVLAKAQGVAGEGEGEGTDEEAANAAAAAEEREEANAGAGADEGQGEGDEGEGEGEGDEPLGKSFNVTLADGTEVPAFDATVLLKGLMVQVEAQKAENGLLAKALSSTTGLIAGLTNTVKAQDALLKSLQGDMAKLRREGQGRKALLSVHDKPAGGPAKPQHPTPNEIMAKALELNKDKKITALDVALLNVRANNARAGEPVAIPDHLAAYFAA